jgi:hypothetical protein
LYSSNLYHFGDHPRIVEIRPKLVAVAGEGSPLIFISEVPIPSFDADASDLVMTGSIVICGNGL